MRPVRSLRLSLAPNRTRRLSLSTLPVGASGIVTRVLVQDAARLRYLASLGLVPGAVVTVVARAPFEGPLTVQIEQERPVLDTRLATTIVVDIVHEAQQVVAQA